MGRTRTLSTPASKRTSSTETAGSPTRDSLREGLIRAGLELLRGQSLETLTLRKVAAAAGVSHAATYRHFDDKNALLAAIAEEGYRRFHEYQQRVLDDAGDEFEPRFRNLGWTYVRFALENPGYARIMFGAGGLDTGAYPALVAASAKSFRQLQQVIRLGQKRGYITPGRTRDKTLAAWSVVHGVAMLMLDGQMREGANMRETEKRVKAIIEFVFTGMDNRVS